MRKILRKPRNSITQGTIFSGIRKCYDKDVECFGITITARCDTARDFKVPVLNFLPVIKFEDWIWHEALPKAIEQIRKTAIGNVTKYLKEKDGSSLAIEAFGPERIFDRPGCTDKIFLAAKELFFDAKIAETLEKYQWNKLPTKSIVKELSGATKKLISNSNQEYFFIEEIQSDNKPASIENLGYVILLREIRSLSRKAAMMLVSGVDKECLSRDLVEDFCTSEFNLDFHEISLIIGELDSPFIEQLMQSFSALFSRVGVPELHQSVHQRFDNFFER